MCFAHYKKNSYFVGIKNVLINKLVISFSLPYLSQKLRNTDFPFRALILSQDPTNYKSTTFYIVRYVAPPLLFSAVKIDKLHIVRKGGG